MRKNQRGFTLIEMLGYLALLGVLLALVYSIFYRISAYVSAADRTLLKERSDFGVVWMMQRDIRRSSKTMDAYGPFKASDGAMILLIEESKESDTTVIIYRFSESENALLRHEANADQPSQGVTSRRMGFEIEGFEFEADKENANLLRIDILVKQEELKERRLGVLRDQPLTFHTLMRNG